MESEKPFWIPLRFSKNALKRLVSQLLHHFYIETTDGRIVTSTPKQTPQKKPPPQPPKPKLIIKTNQGKDKAELS